MTLPNMYLPGQVYLGTRNIQNKAFLLDVEDESLMHIFEYAFGRFAEKWNVTLHSLCVLGNHVHWTCTDNEANYGEFLGDIFRMLSVGYNKHNETSGALWEPNEEPHRVYIAPGDTEKLLEETAYTIINGERHGYTDNYRTWKGLLSPLEQIDSPRTIGRPTKGFGKRSTMPDTAELVFKPPQGFDPDEWKDRLEEAIEIERVKYQEEQREQPEVGYVPPAKPRPTPKTLQGKGTRMLRSFAGRDRLKMLAAYLAFLKVYRQAQNAWDPSKPQRVRFPAGTGAMRRLALVETEALWLSPAEHDPLPPYITRLLRGGVPPTLRQVGFDCLKPSDQTSA